MIPRWRRASRWAGGVSAPYNRGHQVANADRRVSNLANDQISYYSNMTAQRSNFNSGVWAALEGRVRGWMCADTLYVVTGCHFDGSQTSTIDNGGNTLPVPTQYYKVLLRSKNGSTGRSVASLPADELQAIGFWYEHTESSGQNPAGCAKSVSEIERLCGFEFFVNVPNAPKASYRPRTGAYDTRPKQEKACTVACRAFFRIRQSCHIRIGDRQLRPSCREGGGNPRADTSRRKGRFPARRS